MANDANRRKFLACAIGGGVCAAAAGPILRFVLDPAGKQTVTTPREPLDLGPVTRFVELPTKVDVIAPVIKDAWVAAREVVLGAAYIRRVGNDIDARSAVCPHLGCAVSYDGAQNNYLCPCHDSRFALDGKKLSGPSKRGLDQLPIEIVNGRLMLTWERYKIDQEAKEPV